MKASCRKLGHSLSRSTTTLVNLKEGDRLKLVHVALVVTLAGCGGQTIIESSGDSGSGGHGGGSGGSAGSIGAGGSGGSASGGSPGAGGSSGGPPIDGGAIADGSPEPSDGACNVPLEGGACAFCPNDTLGDASIGAWHCGDNGVLPQCPSGAEQGASCDPDAFHFDACIVCESDGTGYNLSCGGMIPFWNGFSVSCL
jgi:hypothetical protein